MVMDRKADAEKEMRASGNIADSAQRAFMKYAEEIPSPLAFATVSLAALFALLILSKSAAVANFILFSPHEKLYALTDWPDTAVMTLIVERGLFFSQIPGFLHGAQMAGLFPPLYHAAVALPNFLLNDVFLSMFLVSVALQLIITYLVAKDWKGLVPALMIIVLLNFTPFTTHYFPFVGRMREMLAVLFMVALFKGFAVRDPLKRYAIFGSLAALTQPWVAAICAVGFPLVQANWNPRRIEKKYLAGIAIIAAIYLLTYNQHFILKQAAPCGAGTIGCTNSALYFAAALPIYVMMFAAIAIFFAVNLQGGERNAFAIFCAGIAALVALTFFPQAFLTLATIFKEDMCVQLYPFICFFALFPPKAGAKQGEMWAVASACALILLMAYSALMTPMPFSDEGGSAAGAVLAEIQSGSTVFPISIFIWEGEREIHVTNFDFTFMSEAYLRNANITSHYSPVQQFYDTECLVPPTEGLLKSAAAHDLQSCRANAKALSEKTEYVAVFAGTSAYSNNSWSGRTFAAMSDGEFMHKCGVNVTLANSERLYLLYRLEK